MQCVGWCVHQLRDLFDALENNNHLQLEKVAEEISTSEHQADIIKNDIRNHLPKGLFLPIDHSNLLEILSVQDQIADSAEDLAVLVSLKELTLQGEFRDTFHLFMEKNIEAFDVVQKIIEEMGELLEYSFGGLEAEKVIAMVAEVAFKEYEVDLLQRPLLKILFASENEMAFTAFNLWLQIIEAMSKISNLSEILANRVRMTLEVK